MTHDDAQRLLIRIIDEVNWIMWYQDLLKIAVEQFENRDSETLDKVELLLHSYLDQTEVYFEELKVHIDRRNEIISKVLPGD